MKHWTIKAIPKAHNRIVGKHWGAAAYEKRRWRRLINVCCKTPHYYDLDIHGGKHTVEIVVYRHTRQDIDNAYASCKPVFDALVHNCWLVDDSPDFLEPRVVEHVERNKGKQRTEITWI